MTNAIIMASGLGVRMYPLTQKTPKPLIKVGNKPMIESVIDALEYRGVNNIFVVVGYLAEQFNYLTNKYKNLSLINNPDYKTVNNISSIYYAKQYLPEGDCYICEADLYISDSSILKHKLKESCYFGKMVKGYSDDWLFDLDENGFITRVGKKGTDKYEDFRNKMDENDPKKFLEELYKEKSLIMENIKKLEESIKDNETKYLTDTVNGGNILRGWEHIFTTKATKNYMGNQPKKTHISNAERLFSQTFEFDKKFSHPNSKFKVFLMFSSNIFSISEFLFMKQ